MKLNSKLLGSAGAFVLVAAIAAPAQAQVTALYSGGGTLAEKVYRDIFNCYGFQAGGDTTLGLVGNAALCDGVKPYRATVEPLYVGVGSGNGKAALVNHNAQKYTLNPGARTPDNPPVSSTSGGAAFGPFNGTGTGAGWVPGTANPFPTVSFSGSDDPLTATDLTTYGTTSSGNFGPVDQFPALVTAIAVPFNPAAAWNPHGVAIIGGSSNVNFATDTLCGIFTGAITDWSDPAFTAANGGVPLGSGPITVIYRNDGSGSTFLFSNALIHQCGSTSAPRAHITHNVPDQWLADNGIANPAGNPDGIGNSNNNFFINVNTGHGSGSDLPANFTGAKGSGGVKAAINATSGATGYVSPDFVKPVDSTGPLAANLQDFSTVGKTAVFKSPTGKNASVIVKLALPPSFAAGSCAGDGDGVCAHDPLKWALTFPKGGKGAYPIGGFTFIDTYSCYADPVALDALGGQTAGHLGLLRWYFGSSIENKSVPKKQLAANGFGLLLPAWTTAISTLLFSDAATKLDAAGAAGKCSSASGA